MTNLLPGQIDLSNEAMIRHLLKIRDKRGRIVPLIPNVAQSYYLSKRRRRNLILKARQKGLSKIIDADQLIDCIKKATNAVVISHEKGATQRLFAAVKFYIDSMVVKPTLSIDSKNEIKFPRRGSSYFIGTAGQKAFGRGDTVDRAHLSEAAFYDDLEKILGGIAEAAEYGEIDIETTPNGRDKFYDEWQKAKQGKSSFTPIFIPWFIDQEYSSDNMTEKEKDGLSDSVMRMFAVPDAEFLAGITAEEKRLVARVAAEYNIVLTAGQLKWRRYKIWDRGAMFWQEYPEDDESCFLQSGRTVFTNIICDITKQVPLDNFEGWGTEEERAELKKRQLYAGVDGAEGTLTGDRHAFAVIDCPANSPKATVIYEYVSNEPIDIFWNKIHKIIKSFKITLGVEKNGVGVAHCKQAKDLNIGNVTEWQTTGTNRPVMITDLEEAYRKGELIESYREAENEARDMIYDSTNKAIHRQDKHDDRIFARAIAFQMVRKPVPRVTML
jgi:hypothetical protein